MIFEHRSSRLIPLGAFLARMARFGAASAGIVGFSLGIGMAGYHAYAGLPWVDSLLNAAMILTGMGPVDRMETTSGKLFAAGYALFSGLAFLTTAAVLFAPIVHRLLHALHAEVDEGAGEREP